MANTYTSTYLNTETILTKDNISLSTIEEWVNAYATFNTKVRSIEGIKELDTFIKDNRGYNKKVISVEEGKKVCTVEFSVVPILEDSITTNSIIVTLYIYLFKSGRVVLELGNTISCYSNRVLYNNISTGYLEDTLYTTREGIEEVVETNKGKEEISKGKVILPKSFSRKLEL